MNENPNRQPASYADLEFRHFIRDAFYKAEGLTAGSINRPVIGICNSWSELNPCNIHLKEIAAAVKRGVLMAGGLPLEFPTISLGEVILTATSMLFRNLMAMDAEEMIRAQPLDGVVLLSGCDKTTPAYLMGASSANIPAIRVTGGPMLDGHYAGKTLGACTDCRRYWNEYRAGTIDDEMMRGLQDALAPSHGHCMVMGTASTMACAAEALGMMLPGAAAIPAANSARLRLAEASGRQIVELVRQDLRPAGIMTPEAFENALRVCAAIGGSTNAVIHLTAIAGRLGIPISLQMVDRINRETPLIADMRPTGRYQMEAFWEAGGVPLVMQRLAPLLHMNERTVTGKTIAENLEQFREPNPEQEVIHTLESPLYTDGGMAVLWGNLAPRGAVIKHHAASPNLLRHRGPAVVFTSIQDLAARIDDPDLPVTPESVLVLQNAGPVGAPGMPEAGMLPIPQKLLKQGIRDMVRLSDSRMSGTAFGTVVLHITPESAIGGPLAAVRDGDIIELDVANRRLHLNVPDEEIQRRINTSPPTQPAINRGYRRLYIDHVLQADQGCDFDFLRADPSGLQR